MKANRGGLVSLIVFVAWTLSGVGIALLSFYAQPHMSEIELLINHQKQAIELPYKADSSNQVNSFDLQLHVTHNLFASGFFHIIPDDCLSEMYINDVKVNLAGIQGLCDWNNGFEVDARSYLLDGDNTMLLHLRDKSGKRGIEVKPMTAKWLDATLKTALGVWMFLGSYFLMQKLRFSRTLSVLFAVAMMVRILYFMETPWSIRSYDVDGHIDYITYIATYLRLPEPDACWTCYHPPLYYITAALFYKVGVLFSKAAALAAVQMLSVLLSGVFAIFVLLVFRLLTFSQSALIAASATVLFYPSLIMHAGRIGNDVLLYAVYAGAFYYYLRWLKYGSGLWLSVLLTAMALFTKGNGVLIMAVLGLAYLLRVAWYREWRLTWRTIVLVAALYGVIVASAAALHVTRSDSGLIGNAQSLHGELFVDNALSSYLYFDWKIMVKDAYADPWKNGHGREYFWNYFWQTSLFGEFQHGRQLHDVASVISATLMIMLTGAVFGFLLLSKETLMQAVPFIMNALIVVVAAMALRYSIPAACSNDFRYSIPLLLSLGYFLGRYIDTVRQRELIVLEWGMYGAVTLFSILSTIFIANL